MVKLLPSKQITRVRFPSPALYQQDRTSGCGLLLSGFGFVGAVTVQ